MAPLRSKTDLALSHADIPGYLEREWTEYNMLNSMIKSRRDDDFEKVIARFWLTDMDMVYKDRPAAEDEACEPAPGSCTEPI